MKDEADAVSVLVSVIATEAEGSDKAAAEIIAVLTARFVLLSLNQNERSSIRDLELDKGPGVPVMKSLDLDSDSFVA